MTLKKIINHDFSEATLIKDKRDLKEKRVE